VYPIYRERKMTYIEFVTKYTPYIPEDEQDIFEKDLYFMTQEMMQAVLNRTFSKRREK
jgi:hypothetical protein